MAKKTMGNKGRPKALGVAQITDVGEGCPSFLDLAVELEMMRARPLNSGEKAIAERIFKQLSEIWIYRSLGAGRGNTPTDRSCL